MSILMYYLSEVRLWRHHADSPLPLSITAIIDHPRVGEVPQGCDPQFCVAPVRIPISFQSRGMQSAGVAVLFGASVLTLSK
jgi:hypothetical protein